jgi:hypothetical protein
MKKQVTTLPITRKALAEMNVIGVNHPFGASISKLTYVEIQQILTLHSIQQLLADYGIECPFHLEIEGLKLDGNSKEDEKED